MGNDNSKFDSSNISENVKRLREKIKTCNIPIDGYAINRITSALTAYQKAAKDRKKGNNENLINVIKWALEEVNSLPTKRRTDGQVSQLHDPKFIKNNIKYLKETIKNNELISEKQFDSYTAKVRELDQLSTKQRKDYNIDDRDIDILFLKWFTKLSFSATVDPASTHLQQLYNELKDNVNEFRKCLQTTSSVQEIEKNFNAHWEMLTKKINPLSEKLKTALEGHKQKRRNVAPSDVGKPRITSEKLSVKSTTVNEASKAKSVNQRASIPTTDKTKENLSKCEEAVDKFQSTSQSCEFKQLLYKLTSFKDSLGSEQMAREKIQNLMTKLRAKASENDRKNLEHLSQESQNSRKKDKVPVHVNLQNRVITSTNVQVNSSKDETLKMEDLQELESQKSIWKARNAVSEHKIYLETPRSLEDYKKQCQQLVNLEKDLTNAVTRSVELEKEKQNVLEKISSMLTMLDKKIFELSVQWPLRELDLLEKELNNIQNSECDSVTKMKALEECRRQLSTINSEDERVIVKKRELTDRLAITSNVRPSSSEKSPQKRLKRQSNLDRKKKTDHRMSQEMIINKITTQVNRYKEQLHNGPISLAECEIKRKQLSDLLQELSQISTEEDGGNNEITLLSNDIRGMLNSVKNKQQQTEEETKIRALQSLAQIENDIDETPNSRLPYASKVQRLRKLREMVMKITTLDPIGSSRKRTILERIKKLEEYLKDTDQLLHIKSAIQAHQSEDFNCTKSSELYKKKKDQLSTLCQQLEEMKSGSCVHNDITDVQKQVRELLQHLDQRAIENDIQNQHLQELHSIDKDLASTDNLNSVDEYRSRIASITTSNEEVSQYQRQLVAKVDQMEEDIRGRIEERQTDTEPVKILDVNDQFEDLKTIINSKDKNSIDFINEITAKAESYENAVREYRGSDYSIEFFILNEKLMRLLEELDKINCREKSDMFTAKIKTIKYIKSLHLLLDNNVNKE